MALTTTPRPAQAAAPNLKRHVGVVGLLFASVGSIIGSGWLFGALNASQQAGPAAVFSWALGGFLILLIALTYAELGTMFPVSGGVVRFPHIAFGHLASFTSGWITYVAIATTAPIEVEAALQYGTRYAGFTTKHMVDGQPVHTLTALGYSVAVVLMALFVLVNYYGVRWFARINNVLVGWKLAMILLVVVAFFVTAFNGHNFSSHGFAPSGIHGVFTAIATSGIVFSYLGFRQGIELAGETDNPRRNVPIAVIGSVLVTAPDLHPFTGCLHRIAESLDVDPLRFVGEVVVHQRLRPARGDCERLPLAWAGSRSCCTSMPSSHRATPV